MIAPDRRGLLSKAAGVLALNSLRVHSASVNSHEGVGDQHVRRLTAFRLAARRRAAAPAVHPGPRRRTRRASARWNAATATPRTYGTTRAGEMPGRGADQPAPRRRGSCGPTAPSPGEFVVQIRSTDRAGLLARLTAVVRTRRRRHRLGEGHHAGIVGRRRCSASPPAGDPAGVRDELERDLYAVLPTPPPAKPAEEAS